MRKTYKAAFILIIPMMLEGCFNMAVSSAQAVYHHHSIQKDINDHYITLQAYRKINDHSKAFADTNITVATFHGEVLLAGQAPDVIQKRKMEYYVKSIPDVDEVHNLIEVSSPSSSLTRLSDAWITAKVKSRIIASGDIDATQIKVVTENGTVYLMGVLRPSEAAAAIELARTTDGVERVVKLFSYIRISKT